MLNGEQDPGQCPQRVAAGWDSFVITLPALCAELSSAHATAESAEQGGIRFERGSKTSLSGHCSESESSQFASQAHFRAVGRKWENLDRTHTMLGLKYP